MNSNDSLSRSSDPFGDDDTQAAMSGSMSSSRRRTAPGVAGITAAAALSSRGPTRVQSQQLLQQQHGNSALPSNSAESIAASTAVANNNNNIFESSVTADGRGSSPPMAGSVRRVPHVVSRLVRDGQSPVNYSNNNVFGDEHPALITATSTTTVASSAAVVATATAARAARPPSPPPQRPPQQQPPATSTTRQRRLEDIASVNIVQVERRDEKSASAAGGGGGAVVYYHICTSCSETSMPLLALRRFSEFAALHAGLEQIAASAGAPRSLASAFAQRCVMPSKFQLGSAQSDEFVAKRRSQLEAYLQGAVALFRAVVDDSGGVGERQRFLPRAAAAQALLAFLGGHIVVGGGASHQMPLSSSSAAGAAAAAAAGLSSPASPLGAYSARPSFSDHGLTLSDAPSAAAAAPFQCWHVPNASFACIIAVSSLVVDVSVAALQPTDFCSGNNSRVASPTSANASERGSAVAVVIRGRLAAGNSAGEFDLRRWLPPQLQPRFANAHRTTDTLAFSPAAAAAFLNFDVTVDVPLSFDWRRYSIERGAGCVVVAWSVVTAATAVIG